MEVCYSMQWRCGYYFFSDSFGYRTIFDECAFSNHFQCRDSHVVTWMHMTSRLNTTRGSQLVAKQWRRCALGDTGPGGRFKSKGQGAFQYSSLRFEVNYPSFWCCLRFLWACYQFHNVYMYICIYMYIYVIYMYIYVYIYIYIYICVFVFNATGRQPFFREIVNVNSLGRTESEPDPLL